MNLLSPFLHKINVVNIKIDQKSVRHHVGPYFRHICLQKKLNRFNTGGSQIGYRYIETLANYNY